MRVGPSREERIEREEQKALETRVGRALGNPHRVRIMEILNEEDAAAIDIARKTGIEATLLAYHMRVLKRLEFVELVERVPARGTPKKVYRSLAPTLFSDSAWAALDPRTRLRISETVLGNIVRRVGDAFDAQTFDAKDDRYLTLETLQMDWVGWGELNQLIGETRRAAAEIARRSTERRSDDPRFPATIVLMSFESPRMYEKEAGVPGLGDGGSPD
jgi:DNA-binding transcriptional ArsR family regulator